MNNLTIPKHHNKLVSSIIFAYWGLFLSFYISGFLMPLDLTVEPSLIFKITNYTTYFWIARIFLLLLKSLKPLYATCIKSNPSYRIVFFLLALSILQILNGLIWIESIAELRFVATESLPLLALGTIFFVGFGEGFTRSIVKMIAIQAFMAGLFSLYIFIVAPIDSNRGNLSSPHFLALSMNFIALFALGNIHLYKNFNKILVIISYVLYIILMIPYQSRGGSINLLLIFPLTFVFARLRMRNVPIMKNTIIIAIAGLSFFYLALQIPYIKEGLDSGWTGTTTRLYGGESTTDIKDGLLHSFSSELANVRGAEAREFISKATLYTWLFGHGYGGSWKSDLMVRGDSWYMVHIGPLHLILKGGIILVSLYIWLLSVALRSSWEMLPYNPVAPGCFSFIFCYFVDFMKHGPIYHAPQVYILWLAIGLALVIKPTTNSNIIPKDY